MLLAKWLCHFSDFKCEEVEMIKFYIPPQRPMLKAMLFLSHSRKMEIEIIVELPFVLP